MYYFLLFFLAIYPFCIFPAGPDPYYTAPKAIYLTVFTFLLWGYYLVTIILKKNQSMTFTKLEGLLLCIGLLVSLSTMLSVDVEMSLMGTKNRYEGLLAWLCYLSLFYFSYRFFELRERTWIYRIVGVSAATVAIYAILQHFLIDFLPRNSDKLLWTRSYAFFDNPNFYGTYTVIMLLILMVAYLEESKKMTAYLYTTTIGLVFVSMLYSLTRSAWLGSFAGFIVLTCYVLQHRELWKKWGVLSMTLFTLFIIVNSTESNSTFSRAGSILEESGRVIAGDSHAGSSRLYIWQTSFPLLKDYYLLGSGPDTFGEVFPYKEAELERYFSTANVYIDKAHNEYLQLAITMGIPVLILYLWILTKPVRGLYRLSFKGSTGKDRLFPLGLLAVLIGYSTQAFFNISVITVAPFFWMMLGFAYRIVSDGSNR